MTKNQCKSSPHFTVSTTAVPFFARLKRVSPVLPAAADAQNLLVIFEALY